VIGRTNSSMNFHATIKLRRITQWLVVPILRLTRKVHDNVIRHVISSSRIFW
jgi:hypothetical protein